VSPYYSFVTIPTRRSPPFAESLGLIWRWWRGVKPSLRERQVEQAVIERMAEELSDEEQG
jgi:hypothetical protein